MKSMGSSQFYRPKLSCHWRYYVWSCSKFSRRSTSTSCSCINAAAAAAAHRVDKSRECFLGNFVVRRLKVSLSRMHEAMKQRGLQQARLRILLLMNSDNSMAQAMRGRIAQHGHTVFKLLATSSEDMINSANELHPDFILCPYLTKIVPAEIYEKYKTFIVHPGIVGDRGLHSLDWALWMNRPEWGVTILEADKDMDAGKVWSTENFLLDDLPPEFKTKSAVYRLRVVPAALKALESLLIRWNAGLNGVEVDYSDSKVLGRLMPTMKQQGVNASCIYWMEDTASDIVRKIAARDGFPGLLDTISNVRVHMYGAKMHKFVVPRFNSQPGRIVSYNSQDGSILLSTREPFEGVWISHLKLAAKQIAACGASPASASSTTKSIKLPAMEVLPSEALIHSPPNAMEYRESAVWIEHRGSQIVVVHFTFHNGAMNTQQCKQLERALKEVSLMRHVSVVVLAGGPLFFSNGIHLNSIEAAIDSTAESIANINAIDDVIMSIMCMHDKVTISALQGSAGAGGVMLAIAADFTYAHDGVMLSPHYRGMGLFGSEYWTFNLPRIVGYHESLRITEGLQPMTAAEAYRFGVIDFLLKGEFCITQNCIRPFIDAVVEDLQQRFLSDSPLPACRKWRLSDAKDHVLDDKSIPLQASINHYFETKRSVTVNSKQWLKSIAAAREFELLIMERNFKDPAYRRARHAFVHKITPPITPLHMQLVGRSSEKGLPAVVLSGIHASLAIRKKMKAIVSMLPENRKPLLAVILVGSRNDSVLYVRKKIEACIEIGIESKKVLLDELSTTDQILEHIRHLNEDNRVNGILVQLPLPSHVDQDRVVQSIASCKDVDGLTTDNIGRFITYGFNATMIPCTPLGCVYILDHYSIPISGKHAIVIGRSNLVGKPMATLLLARDATVTQAHLATLDLPRLIKQADIVIAAIGKPEFIRGEWLKEGAVVVDVGINDAQNSNGLSCVTIVGDVHYESAQHVASAITPVPGGVG